MKIERHFNEEGVSYEKLFLCIIDNQIDTIIQNMYANHKVNAGTSHGDEEGSKPQ